MNAERDTILQAVRDSLAQELKLHADDIAEDDELDQLPGADSVRLFRAFSRIEDAFDFELDDDEVRAAVTVAELVTLVANTRSAAGR